MQLKLKGLLVMQTVEIIVNILMVIVAVLLVIVVLAQNAKSAGLGSAFGNDTTALGQAPVSYTHLTLPTSDLV